jgi:signal peptidase II
VVGVAIGVIALDQLTKWWAVDSLRDRTIHLVWTIELQLTRNTGAAFSRFVGQGPLIAVGALAIVGYLLWQGRTVSTRLGAVAIGMVLGGALGNLADRAFRGGSGFLQGAVVDFINPQWWPVFNVADACVVIGAILLVAVNLFGPAAHPAGEPAGGGEPSAGTEHGTGSFDGPSSPTD